MILEDGTTIHLVHFVFQSPRGVIRGNGLIDNELTWKVACAPNLIEMSSDKSRDFPWQRTDEPRAVNCPLCKRTEEYQAAMKRLGEVVSEPGRLITNPEAQVHLVTRQTSARNSWRVACVPVTVEMSDTVPYQWPHQRTDDPRAVTCELCKKQMTYQRRLQEEMVNAPKVKT